MENGRAPEAVRTSVIPAYREKNDFFHIKDVFIKKEYDIILPDGNFLFLVMNPFQPKLKHVVENIRASVSYMYVVYIPMFIWYSFGHWMNDGLPATVSMPQWVWDLDPVIVCPADRELVKTHLDEREEVAAHLAGH